MEADLGFLRRVAHFAQLLYRGIFEVAQRAKCGVKEVSASTARIKDPMAA